MHALSCTYMQSGGQLNVLWSVSYRLMATWTNGYTCSSWTSHSINELTIILNVSASEPLSLSCTNICTNICTLYYCWFTDVTRTIAVLWSGRSHQRLRGYSTNHTLKHLLIQLTGLLVVALHPFKKVRLPLPSSEPSLEVFDSAAVVRILRHQLALEAVELSLGLHQERGDAGETTEGITTVCKWKG